MTLALNFELKAEYPGNWFQPRSPGMNVTTQGLLMTRVTGGFATENYEFYESTNKGDTWQLISTIPVGAPGIGNRVINLPDNRLIIAASAFENNTFKIYLSTNAGHDWSVVASYPDVGTPTSLIQNFTANGSLRQAAVVGGFINRDQGGGHNSQLTWSYDRGETWNDSPNIVLTGMQDAIFSIQNAGAGQWLLANERGWTWRSNDYGISWTQLSRGTEPGDTQDTRTWSVCCVTDQLFLAGGKLTSASQPYWPYLYRSTNSGDTWTHVAASDIEHWPDSGYALGVRELHRLTKQGVIMGIEETRGRDMSPWRYSIDGGQTWKDPTQSGGHQTDKNTASVGAIVLDANGAIWAEADARIEDEQYAQIWKGTVTC